MVEKRKETVDAGGRGPWLYLYWKNDRSVYQEYSFSSGETEQQFEAFCVELKEKQIRKEKQLTSK